jgi:hypothetical protein
VAWGTDLRIEKCMFKEAMLPPSLNHALCKPEYLYLWVIHSLMRKGHIGFGRHCFILLQFHFAHLYLFGEFVMGLIEKGRRRIIRSGNWRRAILRMDERK